MAARDTYHHGDLRRALIDSGLELLDVEGEDGVSLRAVARRAGVSHAAPYHHFDDKDALFNAMAARVAEQLSSALLDSATGSKHIAHAVQQMGVAYITFAVAHPARFQLLARHQHRGTALTDAAADLESPPMTPRALLEAIVQGQEAGYLAAGSPKAIAITAWAAVHGLAMLLLDGLLTEGPPTVEDAQRFGSEAVKLLGLGFAAR